MSLKKDEQSAAPDLVGKELATTARRQLSRLQAKRVVVVVVAAEASCATQHRMAAVENCMVIDVFQSNENKKRLRVRDPVPTRPRAHTDGRRAKESRPFILNRSYIPIFLYLSQTHDQSKPNIVVCVKSQINSLPVKLPHFTCYT